MTTIKASARAYETWLRAQVAPDFVTEDLDEKHRMMREEGAFTFLRATYWRWAETILEICPDLAGAPQVLAIGDTHLENFGTWRDVEGRLIWGANDFDDAAIMPYPLDLVRLAASALLARSDGDPPGREICKAILAGYEAGLRLPAPVVLEFDHKWLRKAVLLPEEEREKFWRKFEPDADPAIPSRYEARLRAALPLPQGEIGFAPRQAGTGSLGRPRFFARSTWKGGPVLREAKALTSSAWNLHFAPHDTAIRVAAIATGRCRAADPHYDVVDDILVRRLSPNSRKLEVKKSVDEFLAPRMLALMGLELANCHAGDADRLPALGEDLSSRGKEWLCQAATAAAEATLREHKAFA